ncbi:MAG: acyl-CoA/acyl-ACP dehydrogenase [Candidatus Bathyarchaeota archaeon]|nr:acyl-CoA/acyl-ACP dehydrogenase [Candidatus Bathyarchaeota archaeon]MDH5419245.1 acyl-CoA/acyl-ACP dehydrogenase [Candidatus Bathyarchaeota archaeon]MDH5623689.1 acyl-CoA/acyl-ACP dehydrogenase [Candidatus Bathyarchaeota archaeon]MDH5635599.1 acyl-CoA/acyl-ACP dehydrogenase [Candidatus Bathyarchaeota archaeon]MDH5701533.1 acyl-CoA/acyl-ACP dehydrogenase [Candidatus Bathyarchaeota archaeon]
MVDFSFTEEQGLIREGLHDWCEKNLSLEKIREIDEKHEVPKEIIKGMADLGFLMMNIPEEHGGTGADWVTTCIAAEELGYADISIALPVLFLVEASWGFVVDRYCSEQVRENFVKKAIKGEGFIGIAITEAGGGSDVANVKSTAKKESDTWVLNGEKLYTSGTEEAKKWGGGYFVLVRTSPPPTPEKHHLGMTGFFLPINAPGVEIVKRFEDMGRMGISTGGFVMNDVRVPDYHRIGEEGEGFYLTMEGFDAARILIGATCLGAAKRALEIGMNYIKEREAFGRPIAKFEGIQFELADDWAELEALRSLVYRTAWMMDKKYEEGKFSARRVSSYISACKLKIPPFAFDVFKRVMLWFGAYGYTKECPIEMGLRGIMSYMIGAEGTLNIQRTIIARELLGRKYIPYR